jgi:hypothetical protein
MAAVPEDQFSRIINVHWNTGFHSWTWFFLNRAFSGSIVGNLLSAGNPDVLDPPVVVQYSIAQITFHTVLPPPRPDPPPWPGSGEWQSFVDTTETAGWPGDVDLGSNPPGYNGPFINNVTGGAYFFTADTEYRNASSPFDSIPGNSGTLDFSSVVVTAPLNTSGLTFTPIRLDATPSFNPSTTPNVTAGRMTLGATQAIGH